VVYAGENLDLAAQQYGHVTVGQQLVVNAGKGLSLFSHVGGFKAIAHQDDLDLQAQHGDLVMTAAKNVKLFASENEILIAASKKLTLMCGGSYLTIAADGIVCGGPAFTGKVSSVSWPGADSMSTNLPSVGMGTTRRRFQHVFEPTGQPIKGAKYTFKSTDGRVFHGKTDPDGFTGNVELDDLQILSVEFEDEGPHD
jgi:type VI secretion system secreted protein VgrG